MSSMRPDAMEMVTRGHDAAWAATRTGAEFRKLQALMDERRGNAPLPLTPTEQTATAALAGRKPDA